MANPVVGEYWHATGIGVQNIRSGEDLLIISSSATEVVYEYQSDKKKSKKSLSSFMNQCVLGKISSHLVQGTKISNTATSIASMIGIPKEYSVGSKWRMKRSHKVVTIVKVTGIMIKYTYADEPDICEREYSSFKDRTEPLDAVAQAEEIVKQEAQAIPTGCQHKNTKWSGDEEYCTDCQDTIRVITNNPYAVDPDLNKMVKHFSRY